MQPEFVTGTLYLKRGREKPLLNHHPWVFSGAVTRIDGRPQPGDLVHIRAADGRYLALAYYNPHSQIRARVLTWQETDQLDEPFWHTAVQRALLGRERLIDQQQTTVYRLINAEADSLPGLIVDRYADYLVIQCLTLGIDRRKRELAQLLAAELQPAGIIERSDLSVRQLEGLTAETGVLWGETPPDILTVHENGHPFTAKLLTGHKTGFYIDQRDNRALVGQPRFVADREVLNLFAYTGGFAVYAAAAGARQIINVDSSISVLELAEHNVIQAAGSRPQDEYLAGDAFEVLRHYRDSGREFDVVILDPPKFAQSQRDVKRATRGYKDINWLGLRLLRPGGLLATFSCSGLIDAKLFQQVLFGAAVDARRDVQILHHLWQAADHPISLTFPESAYLKGFLCRVW